ncbi:hypothetical protein N7533_012581 [Penicillium manginii]|jgi:hypothetical protein|uniref:uncharacterized protein n=1 Tax=Penicillium manginii TaxID=203109 RepID=UPI002547D081|nr:uncharacterized protein N7533_012581 [Penicillium manginii]KAJ5739797.1 hypothetical protein N7533_012581 [Penicillium manginii]
MEKRRGDDQHGEQATGLLSNVESPRGGGVMGREGNGRGKRNKASARVVGQTRTEQSGRQAGWAEKSRSCAIGKRAGAQQGIPVV